MSSARRILVAGNWKMNGTRDEALAWAAAAAEAAASSPHEVAVFPPAVWLVEVARVLAEAGGTTALGAQACCWEAEGAFTGAISARMAAEAGCRYVLCGHSERRHVFGETDEQVAGAVARALEAGLVPLLCVGETLAAREAGRTREVLLAQMDAGLAALRAAGDPLVVAYEPVWAIGTGKAARPVEAAEAHGWIRTRVAETDAERGERVRILYGGSVKPDNIGGFLEVPDVDGALIGGAALDPVAFGQMARHAPAGAPDA